MDNSGIDFAKTRVAKNWTWASFGTRQVRTLWPFLVGEALWLYWIKFKVPYAIDDQARSNSTYLATVQSMPLYADRFDNQPGKWGIPKTPVEGEIRVPAGKHVPHEIAEKAHHGFKDKYPIGAGHL